MSQTNPGSTCTFVHPRAHARCGVPDGPITFTILTHDRKLSVISRRWRPLWWWVYSNTPAAESPQRRFAFIPRENMNEKHTTAGCWDRRALWLCRPPVVYLWQVTEVASRRPLTKRRHSRWSPLRTLVLITNCRGGVVRLGDWRRGRVHCWPYGYSSWYPETDSDARMNERRCSLNVSRLRVLLHNTVPTSGKFSG